MVQGCQPLQQRVMDFIDRLMLPQTQLAYHQHYIQTECKAGQGERIGLHTAIEPRPAGASGIGTTIATMDDLYDLRERDDGALGNGTATLSSALALQTVLQFRMIDLFDHVREGSLGTHRLFLSLAAGFRFVPPFYHVRDFCPHGLKSPAQELNSDAPVQQGGRTLRQHI